MDRAGQVGADGATHAGSFDITYLGCLPGFILMAPSDESELMHMVATAAKIDDCPCAFRYPRGDGIGVQMPEEGVPLEIGKGRILKEGTKIAILSYGARLYECIKAAEILNAKGLSTSVADARFCKPLDTKLIKQLSLDHEILITVEEGAIGGFASHVTKFLSEQGILESGLKFRSLFFPDKFLPHGKPEDQYEEANLLAKDIVHVALQSLGSSKEKEIDNTLA
jgi:1-deoxy-D-xylulose-5-phosphate synthase